MGSTISLKESPADAAANAVASQVEEVSPNEEDWNMLRNLVMERAKHTKHYRKDIAVKRIFRIHPNELLQGYHMEAARQGLGKPELLFHGTTPENAERIILAGFEMPVRPGMFGRGIYFAKDPLKSIGYARKNSRGSGITRTLSRRSGTGSTSLDAVGSTTATPAAAAAAAPSPVLGSPTSWPVLGPFFQHLFGGPRSDTVQHMLVCDVYLGKMRTVRRARPNFNRDTGLKRWKLMNAVGAKDYNSIRAPGGTLGCVMVTEFVIYQEYQAIPRFLLEFDQVRAS